MRKPIQPSSLDSHPEQPFPMRSIVLGGFASAIALVLYYFLPYEPNISKGLALLIFIAIMWLTEAVHITITALLVPILVVLFGIGKTGADGSVVPATIKTVLVNFASPVIFIFFGGFALATALHVNKLDKKVALWLISLSKGRLGTAILLIALATALLSMWVSNTATAAMMLPLALGILESLKDKNDRGTIAFVLLSIAYAASIGGLGTIVGSPPNAIASAQLHYSFWDWMKVGMPMMVVMLPIMFLVLYLVFKPKLNQQVEIELEDIPWTGKRIFTTVVFVTTALLWILRKPLNGVLGDLGIVFRLSDAWIAITAAIIIVALGLARWKQVSEHTEWGVLLLFGGGLTLSAILKDSGASLVLGNALAHAVGGAPKFIIILIVTVFIISLTEFTSNTASAALLVPVFASVAPATGLPAETLTIVIGIGASCAFIMPVATPPNAIVFGTGEIRQREMMHGGIFLSITSIIILSLYTYFVFV